MKTRTVLIEFKDDVPGPINLELCVEEGLRRHGYEATATVTTNEELAQTEGSKR